MLIAQAIRLVASYVLLYILYLKLSAADIGRYSNFITALAIATPLLTLKPEALVGRAYFNHEGDAFERYAGSTWTVILILIGIGTLLLPFLSETLGHVTGLTTAMLALIPVYAAGYGLNYIGSTTLQVSDHPTLFAVMRGGEGVLRLLIGAILILICGLGWESPLFAVTAATVVMGALSYFYMKRLVGIGLPINLDHALDYAKIGGATVPMTVGAALIQGVDKLLITSLISLHAAGVYAVGSIVASGLWILANSFQQVWMPFLFSSLKKRDADSEKQAQRAILLFTMMMMFIALVISIAGEIISSYFLSSSYSVISSYFWILVIAYALSGIRLLFDNVFYYYGKTLSLSIIVCFGAAVTAVACWVAIPIWGEKGAALGVLLGNSITLLAVLAGARRLYLRATIVALS